MGGLRFYSFKKFFFQSGINLPRNRQDNMEISSAFLNVRGSIHHRRETESLFVSAEICEAGSELPEDTEGCGSS